MLPIKGGKAISEFFHSHNGYIRENFMLKEEVAALSLEIERMEETIDENKRLKKIIDLKEQLSYKVVGSKVIGRVPQTWNNLVIIDKGEKQGIKRKSLVTTEKGLIGTVIDVFPTTSKVMLVSDPSSKIGVVLEKTRQNGVLVGATTECKVIYLSIDSDIIYGEKVFTSGLGGIFPEGILVGTIKQVKKDPVGLFKYAIVELEQDLNTLEVVLCIE
ncbi:MAG: rod shape-determining protein MreC [Candidatus Omnitrophica bacterium]|nr:rod shape-determining protein MreC [Candidatus Omnitrophota bacterium]